MARKRHRLSGFSKTPQVRAAGGVIVRRHPDKGWQVLAVHRPRYDDWSLPKGKLDRGEGWKKGAVREVAEETGRRCELGPELGPSRYRVGKRRKRKLIRWWLMTEPKGRFKPSKEVDRTRWLTLERAEKRLDYSDDRRLAREAVELAKRLAKKNGKGRKKNGKDKKD